MEADCFQNTESTHNQQEHASDMQNYTSINTKSHVKMPGTAPRTAPKTACCGNSPLQQHAKQRPPAEHQQRLGTSTTTALSTTAPWNNTLSNTNPQDPSLREVRTFIAKGIRETRATNGTNKKLTFRKYVWHGAAIVDHHNLMQHFRRGCLVDGLDCFELGAAKSDSERNDRKIAISNSCEKLSTVRNCFGSKQPAKSSNYSSYYHLFF